MSERTICIVTSFNRPKYLWPCLQSMRASGAFIGVVDGGSTASGVREMLNWADDYLIIPNNPGADVLKNEGIKRWVLRRAKPTNLESKLYLPDWFDDRGNDSKKPFIAPDHFIVTSDDFLYPDGWLPELERNWRAVRESGAQYGRNYGMMACPTDLVIERHTNPEGGGPNKRGCGHHYQSVPGAVGIDIMPTSVAMVAGTVMDTAAVLLCGGFPVYGRTGQGDIAISIELRARKWERGYFRTPVLEHLGQAKDEDYPDYSKDFEADDDIWQARARAHKIGERRGFDWPHDRPGTWMP